jgi:hypothetical protein
MNTQKGVEATKVATPRRHNGNRSTALATAGTAVAWMWSKLMTLIVLTVVALLVWGIFFWTDSKAANTMKAELEQRAFTEITMIDAPLYVQSHLFGDRGTYSAKAGNCRVTISTPDGRPTIEVDSTDQNIGAVIVTDADMTKLRSTPQLRYCFP